MNARAPRGVTRLELLRARAAAHRIELAQAVQDVSHKLASVKRVTDLIGSVAGIFVARARAVGAVASAGAAIARGSQVSSALAGVIARLRGSFPRLGGLLALAAGAAFGVALIKRSRRARSRAQETGKARGRKP